MPLSSNQRRELERRVSAALSKEYEGLELFAVGGMAAIFTGINRGLGRKEAIKVLPDLERDGRDVHALFVQECRALAALRHSNVITVFNAGHSDEHRIAWLAEEFIEGETLDARLRYGPCRLQESLEVARGVIAGLQHAHEHGILHRDVKPENVFLETNGRVILADFGIALMTGRERPHEARPPGTVAYMSPEQLRGQKLDARSDLYSFGLLLYEVFTGRHPFCGPDHEVVTHRQLNEQPRGPKAIRPDLPDDLCDLILELLRKDPEGRPSSSAEVLDRLTAILDSVASPAEPLPESVREISRPRAIRWIGIATIAAGATAALALWWGPWRGADGERGDALPDSALVIAEADSSAFDPGSASEAEAGLHRPQGSATLIPAGPSYVRIALTGARDAAHGSVVILDGHEQETRAPAVLPLYGGTHMHRISLRKYGLSFMPAEHQVAPPDEGDTVEVRFAATRTPAQAW